MSAAGKREAATANLWRRLPAGVGVALFYLVLLLPNFSPFFFSGKTLYQGDILLYFEPTLRYITESLSHGRLPLWNPLACGGLPQIAIISPGLFYPPNLLFAAFPFSVALPLSLMLHQWLAGMGTYLLLRLGGRSIWAAFVGGAVLMLCGYMFGSSQCYTLVATFAWTPLCLYLLSRIIRPGDDRAMLTTATGGGRKPAGRLMWVACFAPAFAMQILAGRPEMFLSAALVYLSFVIFESLGAAPAAATGDLPPADRPARLVGMTAAAAGAVLALALAAVALLPVLELYSLSPRMSGLRLSDITLWSAGWFDWLQVVLTQPFGDLAISNYQLNPHYPGLFPYISSLFLGAPALTLAFYGVAVGDWRQKWLWLMLAFLFFLLALGQFGPLVPLLYHLEPSLAVLRYPIKVAIYALFPLTLAAAAGWDAILAGKVDGWALRLSLFFWVTVALAGNAVFLDLGGVTAHLSSAIVGAQRAGNLTGEIGRALTGAAAQLSLVAFVGLIVAALTMQIKHGKLKREVLLGVLGFIVVQPLLVNGPACLWHMTAADFYKGGSPVADWLGGQRRESQENFRILAFFPDVLLSPKATWRPDDPLAHSVALSTWERQILEGDVNIDFGIPSSYGFMPTDTRAFNLLYAGVTARSTQVADPKRLGTVSDAPLHRFCQMTNTRYLLSVTRRPVRAGRVIEPMPLLDPRYFRTARDFPELDLKAYEVTGVLPRAYFRDSWKPVASQVEAMREIFWADRSRFDPHDNVMINVEGGRLTIPAPPSGGKDDRAAEVRLFSDSGEKIEIDVVNHNPGFLILADTSYPGWKVSDSQESLTLYQANGFQKAVFLKPGAHHLEFTYQPHSLFWGAIISATAVVVVLALAALDLIMRRRRF